MHVVVTGGSGFIGRHVVARLLVRGDDVVVADLHAFPSPSVACVVGDLRDPGVVARAARPGHGRRRPPRGDHVRASLARRSRTPCSRRTSTPPSSSSSAAAPSASSRFVFASTNAVAGDVGAGKIDENVLPRPLTPYGATKAAAEMLFSAYAASYGFTTVVLRFTNVYGAGMQSKDSVVARLMRCAVNGGTIQIYGDGEQRRDYVYVTDTVAAVEIGLALGRAETLTIGAGRSVSMNELWQTACAVTGVAIGADHVAAKPGEMPAVVVDTSRARSLGYAPAYDLAGGPGRDLGGLPSRTAGAGRTSGSAAPGVPATRCGGRRG